MGNNSAFSALNKVECSSLKKFKEDTARKMTIHVLSNKKDDCIHFVEHLTNEKVKKSANELLEKKIKEKINLYSFINYKLYDSVESLLKYIKELSDFLYNNPKSSKIFSEVVIVLNNDDIKKQIETIKNEIINDDILQTQPHLNPFFIFLTPNDLNLKGFIPSKTFHYKTRLEDIMNLEHQGEQKANSAEILAFFRRINVLFSYYNELGDIFSFKNSKGEEVLIKIEDDVNIPVFINILLLGRSGAGKSTLINLLLDEKKSIEGGTGFSTTSKNILLYQKTDVPIRFYDVKGIENEETVNNYSEILKNFNGENNSSNDAINAIFYCMEYKSTGTIIEEMENKIFEKLVEFNIPILFILTKCPYNPYQENKNNKRAQKAREIEREKILNAIRDLIKSIFLKKEKKSDYDEFMKNYIKFYFVNLCRNLSYDPPLPPFGLEKVISFFSESVSKEDWEKLEKSCFQNDEEACINLCKNNSFLKAYSEFSKIQLRNKEEALNYLKGLKAGAFFSGWVPGLDIGMEYFYRYKFKQKLKHLYGFDFEKAEKFLNNIGSQDNINDKKTQFTDEDFDKRSNNIKLEESKIEEKIDEEFTNTGRNTGGIIRGAGEIGGIVIKALPTAGAAATQAGAIAADAGAIAVEAGAIGAKVAVSAGLKIASWVLLPVTCIAFGAWSCYNVHKDCHKILDIFDAAFTPLKFETLYGYVKSFRTGIDYLEKIVQKIIEDDEEENKCD